jgi:hypothetical protein
MFGLELKFIEKIKSAKRILLAGAGGGFDVYCGLPLYFALRELGKEVFLANLAFSSLDLVPSIATGLHEVTPKSRGLLHYFPELYLSRFLESLGEPNSVYGFERTGVVPLRQAYAVLVKRLEPDVIVLVDGGTDSLMRGDEIGLGTPEEDALSMIAVQQLQTNAEKYLLCLGFGIDAYHGVCHAHFLESVAALTMGGDYLGAWSLTPEMPAVKKYIQAVRFSSEQMPNYPSIVSNSIKSAVQGYFGDVHSTNRTNNSELFINPLMGLYWAFNLEGVVERMLYKDWIADTKTFSAVCSSIADFRATLPKLRQWKSIPH